MFTARKVMQLTLFINYFLVMISTLDNDFCVFAILDIRNFYILVRIKVVESTPITYLLSEIAN